MPGAVPAVVFRPREWRGANGGSLNERTVAQLAKEINGYPAGTVSAICAHACAHLCASVPSVRVRERAPPLCGHARARSRVMRVVSV